MDDTIRQKRIVWTTVLGTAGVTGMLVAYGATRFFAASMLQLEPPVQRTGFGSALSRSFSTSASTKAVDTDSILARNIFDSALGPLDGSAQPLNLGGEGRDAASFDPNAPLQDCGGGLTLVGSIFVPHTPEASIAAIKEGSGALMYRQGMDVGGKQISEILANAVHLRSGGGLCRLAMFKTLGSAIPIEPKPSSPAGGLGSLSGKTREGIPTAEIEKNIEKLSETSYNINRPLLNKLLENQSALMRSARIVPYKEGDRTVGVKLFGIRRNSLLKFLGLSNGDVLRTINGYDMTSPDSALQAYTRLRAESNLSVSILRGGKPMNFTYNVR